MTTWTKDVIDRPGEYLIAYTRKISPPRGDWRFSVWAIHPYEVPYTLPQGDVWRSVDPITPPSEERT